MSTNLSGANVLILFLDIDGVLHPEGVGEELHFVHLDNFEGVLREFPQIQVVISSTWRLDMSLEELRLRFSEDLRPRIVGVTPSLPESKDPRKQRQRECEQWLETALAADLSLRPPWLALDDRANYFDEGCPNLVLLPHVHQGGTGLEGPYTDQLRNRIRRAIGLPGSSFDQDPTDLNLESPRVSRRPVGLS